MSAPLPTAWPSRRTSQNFDAATPLAQTNLERIEARCQGSRLTRETRRESKRARSARVILVEPHPAVTKFTKYRQNVSFHNC